MNKPQVIPEEKFASLQERLRDQYDRALTIFRNFGPLLSYDVVNVLLHAIDKGKVGEVLDTLEKHWDEDLQFQHPEIRGTVRSDLCENKTQSVFLKICTETLELQPA